jgi:glycosyltransferase involved in cell wall biosynthesis
VTEDDLMVVGTSCRSPLDASFRVRLALPARSLAEYGIRFVALPLFSVEQASAFRSSGAARKLAILLSARRTLENELGGLDDQARTIVVQRSADLAPALTLERAAARGRRLIYDVDDAVWLSGEQTGGRRLSRLKGAARKVQWLAERAAHIIAGNEILAQYLSHYNDHVTVVPSLVDPADYDVREHQERAAVTLGWIGSPTTAPYLRRLGPVLEEFARQSPRPVSLRVVGGPAPRVSGMEVHEVRWTPESERELMSGMDIGLMPLPDTTWTRGKCAYKALQYMACAVPPIVDDVGISAATVAGAGLVANGDDEWVEALHLLAGDPDLRGQLGGVGRRRIATDYSSRRWAPVLADILGAHHNSAAALELAQHA